MSIDGLPFDQIEERHLQMLCDNSVPEGRTLEYKQDVYRKGDNGEFAKDISAMANSLGGHIVIGVAEADGLPISLCGIGEDHDPDQQIIRMDDIARTWIEPRVPSLRCKSLILSSGKRIIVLRVGRSLNRPHQLIQEKVFYGRSNAANYRLGVSELRDMFNMRPAMLDRLNDYRRAKLAEIQNKRYPIAVEDKRGVLLIQIVPLGSLSPSADIIRTAEWAVHNKRLQPIGTDTHIFRVNFHGAITYYDDKPTAYLQAYRNGTIESVKLGIVHDVELRNGNGHRPVIREMDIGFWLVRHTYKYLRVLADLNITAPYIVLISLQDVHRAQLDINTFQDIKPVLTENPILFDPLFLEEIPSDAHTLANALRPIFDHLANAGGKMQSECFGEGGNFLIPLCD